MLLFKNNNFYKSGSLSVVFAPHLLTMATKEQSVKDNVPVNERLRWFLDQLEQGVQCKPADVVAKWDVVEKTAKRDISDLQKKDIIAFIGSPKTGIYKLK